MGGSGFLTTEGTENQRKVIKRPVLYVSEQMRDLKFDERIGNSLPDNSLSNVDQEPQCPLWSLVSFCVGRRD